MSPQAEVRWCAPLFGGARPSQCRQESQCGVEWTSLLPTMAAARFVSKELKEQTPARQTDASRYWLATALRLPKPP